MKLGSKSKSGYQGGEQGGIPRGHQVLTTCMKMKMKMKMKLHLYLELFLLYSESLKLQRIS